MRNRKEIFDDLRQNQMLLSALHQNILILEKRIHEVFRERTQLFRELLREEQGGSTGRTTRTG